MPELKKVVVQESGDNPRAEHNSCFKIVRCESAETIPDAIEAITRDWIHRRMLEIANPTELQKNPSFSESDYHRWHLVFSGKDRQYRILPFLLYEDATGHKTRINTQYLKHGFPRFAVKLKPGELPDEPKTNIEDLRVDIELTIKPEKYEWEFYPK